jgi:peptidoglycan-associated lipoprotein
MSIPRTLLVGGLVALGAGACATKKYVRTEVGEVNHKADALAGDLEKTQQRIQRNETRIDEVGRDADAGKADAAAAMSKATDAQKAARGKLIYTVTLSSDKVKFPFAKAQIADDAKAEVEEALAPIVAENKGVYFEIEGHTDSTGPSEYNMKLGEARAMAVRDYIHDHLGIALSRLSVMSYGETQPVADNTTPQSRAENRRVVVKVLE